MSERETYTLGEAVVLRIRQLIEDHDIGSVHALSRLSGVRQSTLNEILHGRSKYPNLLTIEKIASGLDMNVVEFFDHPIFYNVEGMPNLNTKKKQNITNKEQESNIDNLKIEI